MATARMEFHSETLSRMVPFEVILPNDLPEMMREENPHFKRPAKTLFLLHGYTGGCSDWLYGSRIQEFSAAYNLAVVCPSGENSFYLDGPETGRGYATHVGKELVAYVRDTFGLSVRREDTLIGGLSMGGFGALHTALAYPETFSKAFALSSALIMHEVADMKPGNGNPVANYEYYRMVFGAPEELLKSENNPEELVRRLQDAGKELPGIYMACGTEDFLLQENRGFHGFLEERNVPHTYLESPGEHNWLFWNQYLEPAIQWMLKE